MHETRSYDGIPDRAHRCLPRPRRHPGHHVRCRSERGSRSRHEWPGDADILLRDRDGLDRGTAANRLDSGAGTGGAVADHMLRRLLRMKWILAGCPPDQGPYGTALRTKNGVREHEKCTLRWPGFFGHVHADDRHSGSVTCSEGLTMSEFVLQSREGALVPAFAGVALCGPTLQRRTPAQGGRSIQLAVSVDSAGRLTLKVSFIPLYGRLKQLQQSCSTLPEGLPGRVVHCGNAACVTNHFQERY
jgi:hypothetical protein